MLAFAEAFDVFNDDDDEILDKFGKFLVRLGELISTIEVLFNWLGVKFKLPLDSLRFFTTSR